MNIRTNIVDEAAPELLASSLAALAHPARIAILRHLSRQDACCCKDVVRHLGLAQSTVSQHLKVLVESGLVRFAPERQRSRYTLDREALERISESLAGLVQSCCGAASRG
jgi:ArsR family transcriptional regulator